jgi:hypothetical protein
LRKPLKPLLKPLLKPPLKPFPNQPKFRS